MPTLADSTRPGYLRQGPGYFWMRAATHWANQEGGVMRSRRSTIAPFETARSTACALRTLFLSAPGELGCFRPMDFILQARDILLL